MAGLGQVIRFVNFRGYLRGKEQKGQRYQQPLKYAMVWVVSRGSHHQLMSKMQWKQTVGRIAIDGAKW